MGAMVPAARVPAGTSLERGRPGSETIVRGMSSIRPGYVREMSPICEIGSRTFSWALRSGRLHISDVRDFATVEGRGRPGRAHADALRDRGSGGSHGRAAARCGEPW